MVSACLSASGTSLSDRCVQHGGEIDERTGRWSCPGCTDGYPKAFPAALRLINQSGSVQSTFPHAANWPDDVSEAIIETWVNGWFTTWWQLKGYEQAAGRLKLGRGGFHGGRECPILPPLLRDMPLAVTVYSSSNALRWPEPHMLDGLNKDGSVQPGGDEFLPEANFTNPLDSPSVR